MTSSSNNILHKRLNEIPPVPPPVSTNMVMVSSPATSIHKGLSSGRDKLHLKLNVAYSRAY